MFFEFYMSSDGERNLVDDVSLAIAFSKRLSEQTLVVHVDIMDKSRELICKSTVTEGAMSNLLTENASTLVESNSHVVISEVIDWNSLEIAPLAEDQVGAAVPTMDEDEVYAFVGLRAEDERAEKARVVAENEATGGDGNIAGLTDVRDAELPVDDRILGDDIVFYDMKYPHMEVGSRYATMTEFRAAVRQHAIMGQFDLGIGKSCKERFRGYCKADGCPWSIVARLMADGKQVRVTLNKEKHFFSSTGRVRTKMASFHWIAEKAVPFLKKDQNMGAKKLQKELEDKYQIKIGYSTVWAGRQIAAEKIYGTWEESFGYLFRFKGEVYMRMPGSVVEIDLIDQEDGTKKRKSRAKIGRPLGLINGESSTRATKRKKKTIPKSEMVEATSEVNTSPGPVTRSHVRILEDAVAASDVNTSPRPITRSHVQILHAAVTGSDVHTSPRPATRSHMQMLDASVATSETNTSPGPVTRSQLHMVAVPVAGTSQCSTSRKTFSPTKRAVKKKLTPKKSFK